ncbi:MAG TPA: cupin domain-containing protein [Mycobacteriales bacterium]|nr:cupin domain-containing protein [Mycobacteriales bacterium]
MAPDRSATGAGPAGPALAALVGDVDAFARDHWDRGPLLRRAADLPSGAVTLGLDDIDELLSERALRVPFVRVTSNGTVTPTSVYTSGAGAGASINDQVRDTAVAALLAEGQTVVLQGLHRSHAAVRRFTSALAAELACPVQANAYVTPAREQGFDPHYDVHDVFVVQLAGRKRWRVHEPVHRSPLPDQPWTDHREAVKGRADEEPLLDVVLEPGDVLYLPRGTVHSARSEDGLSAHLTIGVHPPTLHQIARAALDELADDVELRASLPLGTRLDGGSGTEVVRKAMARVLTSLDSVDPQRVARSVAIDVVTATRPDPIAPLAHAQLLTTLDEHTRVVRRRGLLVVIDEGTVRLPEQPVAIAPEERAAVALVLDGAPHSAAELTMLPVEAAVGLVRRLATAGALVAAAG